MIKRSKGEREIVKALDALTAAIERQNDLMQDAHAASNFTLTKALSDVVSGEITGMKPRAGRMFKPGDGPEFAY